MPSSRKYRVGVMYRYSKLFGRVHSRQLNPRGAGGRFGIYLCPREPGQPGVVVSLLIICPRWLPLAARA